MNAIQLDGPVIKTELVLPRGSVTTVSTSKPDKERIRKLKGDRPEWLFIKELLDKHESEQQAA